MQPANDYLWPHLRDLPYFRAVLRAVESAFYQDYDLPSPTLDLGCGDGHFATLTFQRPPEVGLDPWTGPLREAHQRNFFPLLVQGDGAHMPFPDGFFASAISNSVLEHIPHIDAVLVDAARVLRPGAPFLFCVPNQNFLPSLSIAHFLDKIRLRSLAQAYRRFFNRISRHQHCDSPDTWQERLEQAGFRIEKWWHYFSPQALAMLEWGHYFGAPTLLPHILFNRWILAPTRWNLALTERLVRSHSHAVPHPQGTYTFYITRRI